MLSELCAGERQTKGQIMTNYVGPGENNTKCKLAGKLKHIYKL